MQFLCTCTVQFCRKMLESVGHVTCISCFLRQVLSNFFTFTTLGERILQLEHDPQQIWPTLNTCLNSYLFTVHCGTHRHGHASRNTDDFDIRSRCQSLLVTLSMLRGIGRKKNQRVSSGLQITKQKVWGCSHQMLQSLFIFKQLLMPFLCFVTKFI